MSTLDVTVVVPFFGELHTRLAYERAMPSVPAGIPIIGCTGETVAQARQHGLDAVETEWVVHLDADDELTPGYLEAMDAGAADVRVPMVKYTRIDGTVDTPAYWRLGVGFSDHRFHDCIGECLTEGNWVPIGAMARVDLLRKVGGWHDHAWSEDYCMWLRCHLAGATFERTAAVYHAHTLVGGRNQASRPIRNEAHREIAAENGVVSTR